MRGGPGMVRLPQRIARRGAAHSGLDPRTSGPLPGTGPRSVRCARSCRARTGGPAWAACPGRIPRAARRPDAARRGRRRRDACPRLRGGLLCRGAYVVLLRAVGLNLTLLGGASGVPGVCEDHTHDNGSDRRDQPGAALLADSTAQFYPPLHELAPSHENGAYQPTALTRVRFTRRKLPRVDRSVTPSY